MSVIDRFCYPGPAEWRPLRQLQHQAPPRQGWHWPAIIVLAAIRQRFEFLRAHFEPVNHFLGAREPAFRLEAVLDAVLAPELLEFSPLGRPLVLLRYLCCCLPRPLPRCPVFARWCLASSS